MLETCFFILIGFIVVLSFYFLLELNYFLRAILCVLMVKMFKTKKHILDEITVSGICLLTDVDFHLNHMNNARYVRELDFAKIDFYERTGLYSAITAKGGSLFAGATTIRYRKFIKIFSKYYINSKIIYWDHQYIYLQHKFITNDKFVNAIAMSRLRLVKCDAEQIMEELIQNNLINNNNSNYENVYTLKKYKPEMSEELATWIESNQISSEKLRNIDVIDKVIQTI